MRNLFARLLICLLIVLFAASPAEAFDLQIGHLRFGPSPANTSGQPLRDAAGFGALLTVPLGFSRVKQSATTLNGQDISHFTKQDAKDSFIVIMMYSVAIGLGVLTVSAASQ